VCIPNTFYKANKYLAISKIKFSSMVEVSVEAGNNGKGTKVDMQNDERQY
jgi:hypothetical protein